MTHLKQIYLVGTAPEGDYASFGRSWHDTRRIRAFADVRGAARAEALGDVCIPGYFAGEDDPSPMSSASTSEIVAALKWSGIADHLNIDVYDGELELWSEGTNLWVENLTADQAQDLRTLFDRHADPSIVGRRSIYRVEVK